MMPELLPPNPKAPAGPPPAFEASILDRARETAFTGQPDVTALPAAPEPVVDKAPEAEDASYDAPPSRAERAEEQVTTLRRIETPYDTATIDVSR